MELNNTNTDIIRNLKRGFTLVELLVAISIATLIMAAVVPQTLKFNAQSQLRAESRKFVDVLSLAKAKGNSADTANACTDFQGYGVIVTSASGYKMRRCCTEVCTDAQSTDIQTYTLPPSTTFYAPTVNTIYRFKPLSETKISPVDQTSITLKQGGINSCLTTTVSPTGLIQTASAPVTCP